MPRPRIFEQRTFIGFHVDYEDYLLIKELAFRERKTLSEFMRDAIREYIAQKYRENILKAQDYEQLVKAGETINELSLKLNYSMFKVNVKEAEKILLGLKKMIPRRLDWFSALEKLKRQVNKCFQIANQLPKPPEKEMKKLIEIVNEMEQLVEKSKIG
mgnify:CR=1 FL=1